MSYIILDRSTGYYLTVDPTPKVRFLLRQAPAHATLFAELDDAREALDSAYGYLGPHYTDLELVVRPMSKRRLSQRQAYAEIEEDAADFLHRALSGSDLDDA